MTASKQTRLKLRKGFIKAPIEYRVLTTNQLSIDDLRYVLKTLATVRTFDDAKKLIAHNSKNKWGLIVSVMGFATTAAVVKYKGIEVALLYRRLTNIVVPAPEDPVPTGVLENPDDVWVSFLLIGAKDSKLKKLYNEETKEMSRSLAQANAEVSALEQVIKSHEHTIRTLQGRLKIKEKK